MPLLYALLAAAAGVGLVVQAGVNATLGARLGAPLLSASANFLTGVVALTTITLVTRTPLPSLAALGRVPLWQWCGGLLGSAFVFLAIVVAPRLGAGLFFGILVAAQMGASIVVDAAGLFGFAHHPVTLWRALGAMLIVAGVILVRLF